MNKVDYSKKRAVIVIHESGTGPGHDLRDYLLDKKIYRLLFIAHPLLYFPDNFKKSSRYELYENGKLKKEEKAYHWQMPEPLLYIKDTLYSIYWSLRYIRRADLFFGVGNLNVIPGLLLRSVGLSKQVIYYVIDYVPIRFQNAILNTIYHFIEKIAADHSSWTWNLSPRMILGREEKWMRKFPNQLVVSHGVHIERIKRVDLDKINKTEILFMGVLLEKQGIQLVINALPEIIKKMPKVILTLIGKGPYDEELKRLVAKLHVKKYVRFLGYMKSHEEMENRIARAAITVALYNRDFDKNDFTYYADPGKLKNYLGAGVPVIMTDVPHIAQEIEKAKCGFVINYNKEDLTRVITSYLSDEKEMREYRKNAVAFAKKYKWNDIFENALAKISL